MKRTSIFLILLFAVLLMNAQSKSLSVGIFDKSVTLYPFYRVFEPSFYPGIYAEYEQVFREGNNNKLSYGAHSAVFFHEIIGRGIRLGGNLSWAYKLKSFEPGLNFGLAYLHTFQVRTVFKQNADGVYEQVSNIGRASFSVNIACKLVYNLDSFKPFISYNYLIQLPYNQTIPFLATSELMLGVILPLKSSGK